MAVGSPVARRAASAFALGLAAAAACPLVFAAGPATREAPPAAESALVELGRRLFFDPAAGRTGMRSCADCHDPLRGFTDADPVSHDAFGDTPRRSQTLIDCGDSPSMHWEGTLPHIEDVVIARVEPPSGNRAMPEDSSIYGGVRAGPKDPPGDDQPAFFSVENAGNTLRMPTAVLESARRYREAFTSAFGDTKVDADRIAASVSAFVRTIRSGDSAYDRFAAGDATALTDAEKRGLELFRGKARCASCHRMDAPRATFSDYELHYVADVEAPGTQPHGVPAPGLRVKTPTLRDVARRGPYLHLGTFPTLESAVRFFLTGEKPDPAAGTPTRRDAATDGEVDDIVCFLRTLTSRERPGAPTSAWSARAQRTELRFVDDEENALCHRSIDLVSDGEALAGGRLGEVLSLTTDCDGWVRFVPPLSTHVRVAMEGGVVPEGGCWIPDTCAEAQVVLPVRGVGAIEVVFAPDAPVPGALELRHRGAAVFPERRVPRTVLRLYSSFTAPDGTSTALYDAPIRIDVPKDAILRVPCAPGKDRNDEIVVQLNSATTPTIHLEK